MDKLSTRWYIDEVTRHFRNIHQFVQAENPDSSVLDKAHRSYNSLAASLYVLDHARILKRKIELQHDRDSVNESMQDLFKAIDFWEEQ